MACLFEVWKVYNNLFIRKALMNLAKRVIWLDASGTFAIICKLFETVYLAIIILKII